MNGVWEPLKCSVMTKIHQTLPYFNRNWWEVSATAFSKLSSLFHLNWTAEHNLRNEGTNKLSRNRVCIASSSLSEIYYIDFLTLTLSAAYMRASNFEIGFAHNEFE